MIEEVKEPFSIKVRRQVIQIIIKFHATVIKLTIIQRYEIDKNYIFPSTRHFLILDKNI